MRLIRPPFFASLLMRKALRRLPAAGGGICLSFDDGPSQHTPEILSVLGESGIKSAFFCLGGQIEKYPGYFSMIRQGGHIIGNHSYSHYDGWKTGFKKYTGDAEKGARLSGSDIFRPPYGRIGPCQYRSLAKKYSIALWDVMCYDFDAGIDAAGCAAIIRKYARAGSIVVFHDSDKAYPRNIECLKIILKEHRCLPFSING